MKPNESTLAQRNGNVPPSASSALPWLLILLGWVIVLGAMSAAVFVAIKHPPESVPLDPPVSAHGR
ncbi:MAG: hypothetical protein WCO60_19805 [Verrucomicrobiota bacterium]